jgi:hypothetical protein
MIIMAIRDYPELVEHGMDENKDTNSTQHFLINFIN